MNFGHKFQTFKQNARVDSIEVFELSFDKTFGYCLNRPEVDLWYVKYNQHCQHNLHT